MRRFIYYDKDGIESYLAQITAGISVSSSNEITTGQENSKMIENKRNINSDIGAKLAGIGAEIQEDVTTGETNNQMATKLVKSLEEKVMSDYAFEKIYDYFLKEEIIKTSDFKIGDVVSLNENVTFFDFDYFEKLFSEKGAYTFSIKQQKNEIKNFKDSLTNQQKQDMQIKLKLKELEEQIKSAEEDRKNLLETIDVARNTLPYTRFIMTKECLIVLNDNNFRDNPQNVAFKYGGQIEIIGYVTNLINENNEFIENNNAFAEIYKFVNQVLLKLYTGKTEIYVIHPLAMYY